MSFPEESALPTRAPFLAAALALGLLVAAPCLAAPPPAGENVTYAYAQVLRVTPVVELVRIRVPGQRCDGARCRTVELERSERRTVAYDVEYLYKGETFMSRLARDPGSRLRIRVAISPDESADYVH